mgnify:CR=1 FL=1
MVGGVLVAGTLITVIIDVAFKMPLPVASFIGLSIALVKAAFVVAIFMHYKWDKKLIKKCQDKFGWTDYQVTCIAFAKGFIIGAILL